MGNDCFGSNKAVEETNTPGEDSPAAKEVPPVENAPTEGVEAPTQSPEEVEEQALKDAFTVYDKNNDGVIQKEELAGVLEAYHGSKPTDRQLGKIMRKVDLNADGVIDYPEFVKMMHGRNQTKNDIRSSFDAWDENKDGFISREELKKILNAVEQTDDEEIDEILACADVDKDGQINIDEFMKFFK